ncbi:hypothetical protein GF358_01320 [Candidatus Woesearchaeota archaeon]|nr:hypothetical protein [Candidatus Woesearchaeota archaeon]
MKFIMPFLIIGLLLVSACSNGTIEARPIDAKVVDVEINVKEKLCDEIQCKENQYCVNGECVCNDDLKMCKGDCIDQGLCCDSGDCGLGEFCENNKCVKHVCPFNQIYDSKKESCVCDKDSNWCISQNKCIPLNNCCVHSDCGNNRACSPTYFWTSVCVDDGREKCRSILEGQNAYFTVNGKGTDIEVKSVSEDFVSLKINDKEVNGHPVGAPYTLNPNAKLYIEATESAGGICHEE